MVFELLKISAIGGLIFLDSAPIGQWMISQPVVCGPLIGWFCGDPIPGFIIGGLIQLLWAGKLPIGSSCPPESSISAMVATIVYIFAKQVSGIDPVLENWVMVYAISCGIGAGTLAGKITIAHRQFNNHFAVVSDQYALEGASNKINLIPWQATGLLWLSSGVLIFMSCEVALALLTELKTFNIHIRYFQYAPWILIALGMAIILDLFQYKKRTKILIAGLIVGLGIGCFSEIIGQ